MAEPFGVGVGIVGVLGLTIQITQVVVQFGLEWKDAPAEVKSFMAELQSLKSVLSETRTNLEYATGFQDAFRNESSILLSELGPHHPSTRETSLSIESCKDELEKLLLELKKRSEGRRIGWGRLKLLVQAKSTQKAIARLFRHCQILNQMVTIDSLMLGVITHREVNQTRREQREWRDAEENQRMLNWLSTLGFEEKQKDILSQRHVGTGQWFLDRDDFKAWRNGHIDAPPTLWCPGIPGAGKSIITSIVIDHLQNLLVHEDVSIAYIYCDYKDPNNQTTINLLSSLAKQLLLQHTEMSGEVIDMYSECGNGRRSMSLDEISKLLLSFSNRLPRSFILVDALDEHFANEDEEDRLCSDLIDRLQSLQRHNDQPGGCSLFFTSRENYSIREQLADCTRLDICAADSDIELYLRSRILDKTKFRFADYLHADANLCNSIVDGLVRKAQGMFLLPRLHLDRLMCQTTIRNLREALQNLPTKLNDTYDDAMARILGQVPEHRDLAFSALSWISSALRPLRLDELRHALALRPGDQFLNEEAFEDEALIISVSAGLVTIDHESETMRFVHFTVEQYFKETKPKWFPDSEKRITETCLTYLLLINIFGTGRCISNTDFNSRLEESPFLHYAALNWGVHARKGIENNVQDLALSFLKDDNKVSCSIQVFLKHQLVCHKRYVTMYTEDSPQQVTGMHLVAFFGLPNLARKLVQENFAADPPDENGQTPLFWAAQYGHEAVAKTLIDQKVAKDLRNNYGQSPLSAAAANGHEALVQLLLNQNDVAADSQDQEGVTPLLNAAWKGHEAVVRLLLQRSDVLADSQDEWRDTPLLVAVQNGHETIAKLLLDRKDVAADSRNLEGQSPLSLAAQIGQETIVKLLIARDDVAIDSRDNCGKTPLVWAQEYRHEAVVKLLSRKMVDDQLGDSTSSCLQLTSRT